MWIPVCCVESVQSGIFCAEAARAGGKRSEKDGKTGACRRGGRPHGLRQAGIPVGDIGFACKRGAYMKNKAKANRAAQSALFL